MDKVLEQSPQPNPETIEVAKKLFGGDFDQAVTYLRENPDEGHDIVSFIIDHAGSGHVDFSKSVLGILTTRLAEKPIDESTQGDAALSLENPE